MVESGLAVVASESVEVVNGLDEVTIGLEVRGSGLDVEKLLDLVAFRGLIAVGLDAVDEDDDMGKTDKGIVDEVLSLAGTIVGTDVTSTL